MIRIDDPISRLNEWARSTGGHWEVYGPVGRDSRPALCGVEIYHSTGVLAGEGVSLSLTGAVQAAIDDAVARAHATLKEQSERPTDGGAS
jgi:hypothetical protein